MIKKILLVLIIVLAFVVRQYKIDNAIADWHSWRQADTAAVARNFYKEGFNPFLPKYDDMSRVSETSLPNPNRYRFVEFPIYNSIVYGVYLINGGVSEKLAREVTVVISLGSILFIYFIAKRYYGVATGLMSAFLLAVLPYSIYYSRVVLPDPLLIFFCLGMIYYVDRWIFENRRWLFWLSVLFTACAFLTKPTAIFYFVPLLYLYYQKEQKLWPIPRRYLSYLALSFAPFIAWRVWIQRHPEGIPASKWLLNATGIRFRPAFWRWILMDRFDREILSGPGMVLFAFGMFKKPLTKEGNFMHLLMLSMFLYLIIFATGNVQHDYYQILIIPMIVIFLARGCVALVSGFPGMIARIWTIGLVGLFLPLALYFAWIAISGLYQINNDSIVIAGQEADRILPKNAVVIAPYQGDTSFLYQTNRHGWAFVIYSVPQMIKDFGITSYVAVSEDARTKWVMRRYTVLEETPKYVIVDLTKPNPNYDPINDPEPN